MKKGFTLIELLAVIVILAIIALIATPIILGIIKNAKEESNERSVDLYVKAAELAVARKNLASEFKPTECTVADGECTCDGETLNVEVENGKGINGTITFNDKGIVTDNTLAVGDGEPSSSNKTLYENGEIVYINVTTGKGCKNYHEDNSKTGYNGLNPTGNQTSCLKFYAFNDTEESDKVNLLLDHNTSSSALWNSSGSSASGPNELLTGLVTDTSGWSTNILTPTNYTSPSYGYSVNYTTRARLITAQEIGQITNTDWNEKTSTSSFSISNYGWLYDRTTHRCEECGCLHNAVGFTYGFWTVSANAGVSSAAWIVTEEGTLSSSHVFYNLASSAGIRPVIEVSKDLLK